jgi:hypothetical protein
MGDGVNLIFFGGQPRDKKAVANVHIFQTLGLTLLQKS